MKMLRKIQRKKPTKKFTRKNQFLKKKSRVFLLNWFIPQAKLLYFSFQKKQSLLINLPISPL